MAAAQCEDRPEKEFGNPVFQARMKHVYAQVSPQAVILCLFVIAVVFIPVGASTIIASDAVFELSQRYDKINECTYASNQGAETFPANINGSQQETMGCTTNLVFHLPKTLIPPVYIYYGMKGFNQNYRLYAKSFNEAQLSGRSYTMGDLEDCEPRMTPDGGVLQVDGNEKPVDQIPYVPCGQVPWSMFNDTISLYAADSEATARAVSASSIPSGATPVCLGGGFSRITNQPLQPTSCSKDGIAFSQDIDERFSADASSSLSAWTGKGYNGSTNNVFFANGYYNNEAGHQIPIITDQDFMVWARIAPLANFRKLYRIINVELPAGWYVWRVNERFDVSSLEAEKRVILATVSWIGGKHHVLGALYLTMGSISLLLAFGFVGMYIVRNKE